MREIKFRAWDKDEKKMLYHDTMWASIGGGENNEDNFVRVGINTLVPDAILMQYTGLHDKNGKEIYEGDVVKFITEFTPRIGTVEWDDEYSRFAVAYKTAWIDFEGINKGEKGIEVIGNIYENHELLK